MTEGTPKIEESWQLALQDEFSASYFIALREFLKEEKKKNVIFPPGSRIFAAFNFTPFKFNSSSQSISRSDFHCKSSITSFVLKAVMQSNLPGYFSVKSLLLHNTIPIVNVGQLQCQ